MSGPGKQVWRVVSTGSASHNGATKPGDLMITIWGRLERDPAREIAVDLGEDAVRNLLGYLMVQYGIQSSMPSSGGGDSGS